ncbi:MAG: prefoldin subunit alpha [Nanoarchaeota archaeon]
MVSEAIKRKYMQFKMIEEQVKETSEHLDRVEKQQQELGNTLEALEALPDVRSCDEVLVPLAAGIFIKGSVDPGQRLLVNVGSSTVVEKDIPEVRAMVEEQRDQLTEYEKQLSGQMMRLSELADTVNEELAELQKQGG